MPKKQKLFSPKTSPAEERPLASFLAEASGNSYQPLSTLVEAKKYNDGILILQGDDGGQIYVVARAADVKCSVETLKQLLIDLDEIAWPGNDANSRRIYYERRPIGSGIAGGMGGGFVSATPWIHEKLAKLVLSILAVLRGERTRIQ
jgi:hypothetical protein